MQQIALVVLLALAATTFVHAHVGPESSVHCNLCIQQSHAVVADVVEVAGQPHCEGSLPSLEVSQVAVHTSAPPTPRAPPV